MMRPRLLPLVSLLAALPAACGQPESLWIGDTELPWADIDEARRELAVAFPQYGPNALVEHLLMEGMGVAALLHAAHPQESQAAHEAALGLLKQLEQGADVVALQARWAEEHGLKVGPDGPRQPNPAALGARVAAKVAVLEPGEWAGPLKTSQGWEVIYLSERSPGSRHRANVDLYRFVCLVGDGAAHDQAQAAWATLPLRGNAELILALPVEFRRGRTTTTP